MKKIFTVLDIKAEAYLQPFFVPTTAFAVRSFAETCNTPDHDFQKFPEDYVLIDLGEYDEQTGIITSHPTPMPMGKALDYRTTQLPQSTEVQSEIDFDNPGKNT